MPKTIRRETQRVHHRPSFDCIALLLQGGGALGAYQAGVYEALAETDLHPDWVAGVSIGAINSALIAGNPPEARVERLRQFWEGITTDLFAGLPQDFLKHVTNGDWARGLMSQMSAHAATLAGVPGLFAPRVPPPWTQPTGAIEATSLYSMAALKSTLERLVDFDRINAMETRFSVGAVNVRSGEPVYFDATTHRIQPEHVMASCASPPGFSAVEIDGEHYWDGGLVSSTPLQWVLDGNPRHDTLAFQVDLWCARGEIPGNLADVETRRREIQYSGRTRAGTDQFKYAQCIRNSLSRLLDGLPQGMRGGPDVELLKTIADRNLYNIVHLTYRSDNYARYSKDYEFSRSGMEAHWRAGYQDTVRTLRHPEVLERPTKREGVAIFDLDGE